MRTYVFFVKKLLSNQFGAKDAAMLVLVPAACPQSGKFVAYGSTQSSIFLESVSGPPALAR